MRTFTEPQSSAGSSTAAATRLLDESTPELDGGRLPSEYAPYMPLLRAYAALPTADPRRAGMREDLILAFLPVVEHLARRHVGQYTASVEDLRQPGIIALINAIDRWDPERANGEFPGHLIPCVRGEMLRWFRDRTWSMRVPRRIKDLTVAIERAVGPLSHSLGPSPRPSELAAEIGAELDDVIEALHAKADKRAGSLDVVDAVSGRSPVDQLGSVDRGVAEIEARQLLRPLLDELPDRERTIIALRFFGELSQAQIAERVGLSQMHVSRLLKRTLDELRAQLPATSSPTEMIVRRACGFEQRDPGHRPCRVPVCGPTEEVRP